MKKILRYISSILIIAVLLSGCAKSYGPSKATAVKELEDLFTTIDLMDATIDQLQIEMEEDHVTSEQLTQMYIDRIEAYDKKLDLNSVIFINPQALDDAKELDEERKSGNIRGPLHGIPIVVKANCDIAGMATTAGSNSLANNIASEDCFVVKQLKDAGAVILAQTNMSEFAQASVTSRSTLGGITHNAYDNTRTPGGSSGGTAVAVASNFAAAGVGTDTGGSIRNPASFANLYGIKPSKGLTSINGVIPLKAYRDTTGPMARTAKDLSLMLQVMAGTDENDDYTLEADANSLLGNGYIEDLSADALKGMRIGYLSSSFQYFFIDEEIYENDSIKNRAKIMLDKTTSQFVKAGAVFVDISEELNDAIIKEMADSITTDTFLYDINKYLHERGDSTPYNTIDELMNSGSLIMNMNLGMILSGFDEYPDSFEETENPYTDKFGSYYRISEWRTILEYRKNIEKIMKENEIDAIMYLNFFDVPQKEDIVMTPHYNMIAYDITFGSKLGLPDISIPMGFSTADEEVPVELPLGLSFFASYGQDEKLLRIAYAYEQQAGSIIRRSPDLTPALRDDNLNAFVIDLIDRAYSIDYSRVRNKPEGKIQIMLNACQKALNTDKNDPYAVYETAYELAKAYDNVMNNLS